MSPRNKDLGKSARSGRFKILRMANGLTQQALADSLNVSLGLVTSWEGGGFVPRDEKLRAAVSEALQTSDDYYHSGEDAEFEGVLWRPAFPGCASQKKSYLKVFEGQFPPLARTTGASHLNFVWYFADGRGFWLGPTPERVSTLLIACEELAKKIEEIYRTNSGLFVNGTIPVSRPAQGESDSNYEIFDMGKERVDGRFVYEHLVTRDIFEQRGLSFSNKTLDGLKNRFRQDRVDKQRQQGQLSPRSEDASIFLEKALIAYDSCEIKTGPKFDPSRRRFIIDHIKTTLDELNRGLKDVDVDQRLRDLDGILASIDITR